MLRRTEKSNVTPLLWLGRGSSSRSRYFSLDSPPFRAAVDRRWSSAEGTPG